MSTRKVATTASTASTSATPEVTTPPGVRYGRSRFGSRERSTMCESIISTYDTVAPKTAMLIIVAPSSVIAARGSRSIRGHDQRDYGTLRPPVTDSGRGK